MSRASTDLGSVPLQPTARVVDTFISPEVRYKPKGGSLTQLASALQQLGDPKGGLADILNRRQTEQDRQAAIEGAADAERHALDTMDKFKAAVAEGKIKEHQSPFYLTAITQAVARKEASSTMKSLWMEYQDDAELRGSNDPKRVEQWVNEKIQPLMQREWDQWGLQAVVEEVSQERERLLSFHVRNRSEERQKERRAAHASDVRLPITQFLEANETIPGQPSVFALARAGNAEAQAKVSQLTNTLRQKVTEGGRTLNDRDLKVLTLEAIASEAEQAGDSDLADKLITDLYGSDDGESRDLLKSVKRKIADDRIYTLNVTDAEERRQQKVLLDGIWSNKYAKLAKLRETDPKATVWDVKDTAADLAKLDPEFQAKLFNLTSTLAAYEVTGVNTQEEKQRQEIKAKLFQKIVKDGVIDWSAELTLPEQMALADDNADVSWLNSLVEHQRQNKAFALSDPATEEALWDLKANGLLTTKHVLQAHKSLSNADFDQWMGIATSRSEGAEAADIGRHTAMIATFIQTRWLDEQGRKGTDELTGPERAALDRQATAAAMEFRKKAEEINSNPTLPSDEKKKRIADLRDTVAKEFNGYDQATFINRQRPMTRPVVVPQVEPEKSAQPEIAKVVMTDPAYASIKEEHLTVFQKALKSPAKVDIEPYEPRFGSSRLVMGGLQTLPVDDLSQLIRLRKNTVSDRMVDTATVYDGPGLIDVPDTGGGTGWKTVQVPNVKEAYFRQEIEQRNRVVERAKALNNVITQQRVRERFAALADRLSAREKSAGAFAITVGEKRDLLRMHNLLTEHALARKNAGYDVDEAPSMHKNLWKHELLFANSLDLDERGIAVARQLGISPDQYAEFENGQRLQLRTIRNK